MRAEVAYSYVRDLLERISGERPTPDPDGDLPVTLGGARFYVRIVGSDDPWVQVFSVALADIPATPELLAQLNDINARIRFARALHVNDQVLLETEIWADDVNPANLHHACHNVATATDQCATDLQQAFGGRRPFEESKQADYPTGSLATGSTPGPYL